MSDKRVILVTGANGFVGEHLVRELVKRGHSVIGTGISPIDPENSNNFTKYFSGCDLTDDASVSKLPLETVDSVINLAGLAQVGGSFSQEDIYMRINVSVHTTIAKRLLQVGNTSARVIAVSSGAVYESVQPMPLNENSKLVSTSSSPYAKSKIAMELAMNKYRSLDMNVVIVRPFNHIGPGQLPGFLVPDLYEKIIATTVNNTSLTVGNLATKRDYTDVRDIVKAYAELATKENVSSETFNVCSGVSHSGQEILDIFLSELGIKKLNVTVDQSSLRPNDPQELFGNNRKLYASTGWKPTIDLRTTLRDFIAWKQQQKGKVN